MSGEREISAAIEAKLAEFEGARLGLNPWGYRWPLGPCPLDDGGRTAPHGDPLRCVVPRDTGEGS